MNDNKMTPGNCARPGVWGQYSPCACLACLWSLPVLTTYGMALQGASEALIGLAIGIYGLAQAVFQIPSGLLSDRIGRKPLIVGGLLIFVLGSVIAALTDSIWGIILGRALQGSGAIAAAVMALLSDLTREQNRTKSDGLYRRQLRRHLRHRHGAGADCHPPAGSARAVLDDRHPGDRRHPAHPVGGAQQP